MYELTEWNLGSTFRPIDTLDELLALARKQWGPRTTLHVLPGGVVRVFDGPGAGNEVGAAVWRRDLELPPVEALEAPADVVSVA